MEAIILRDAMKKEKSDIERERSDKAKVRDSARLMAQENKRMAMEKSLRHTTLAAKEAVFCDERAAGTRGELEAMCGRDGATLRLGAMLLGGGVVYASMYWTDLLGEMVQDSLEQADNRRLLDFAGLMHQSTLVGIRRFEDRIHQRFEELVQLGFLKPRW